ncbi:MAG: hypothetical protein LCH54_03800 [Bacteroidetes bacterium]|nr:hypothetical protein [Bacteroidota bacterium]
MELTLQFKHELNDFQKKIMDEWKEKTSKRIGVSIQTDLQVQDHNESHTRIQPTNSYCQHWVENNEHVKKCDRLDIELKEELKTKHSRTDTKGLACKCHKGVSNFVNKIELYNTTWYIYYGQFVLSPLKSSDEVVENHGKENLKVISNDIVKKKLSSIGIEYFSPAISAYIKENPVTTTKELATHFPKNFRNSQSKLSDIAVIDLFDFLLFKDFVERKFIDFLVVWHNKNNSVLPNYIEEYKQPKVVQLTKFGSALGTQKDIKKTGNGNPLSDKTIETLQEIIRLLTKIEGEPSIILSSIDLKLIDDFAELEDQGKLLTQEWIDKSKPIVSLLKSILKEK